MQYNLKTVLHAKEIAPDPPRHEPRRCKGAEKPEKHWKTATRCRRRPYRPARHHAQNFRRYYLRPTAKVKHFSLQMPNMGAALAFRGQEREVHYVLAGGTASPNFAGQACASCLRPQSASAPRTKQPIM
jgi:hypothetical protein